MADTPKVGDRVLYRGRYREIIGFQAEPEGELLEEAARIVVYQNPETERNTYSRTEDLAWSDHFGAWYPVGLLLSREECVVYAALPSLPGGDVPQAQQHERAARMLEEEELTLGSLSDSDRETLERTLAGYWPNDPPEAADVFAAARQLRDHRQEEA